jgi:hypothetical protein
MIKLITPILLILTTVSLKAENLPRHIEHHNEQFELCQDFTLRYGLIIKVAEIGWYAPDCLSHQTVTAAPNKIVRFHYHKNVPADFFKNSAEEYFLLNLNNQTEQVQLSEPLKKFNEAYTDIKSGEYFDLVHLDDQKISLLKNNQLLITKDDPIFARKYFNIWFGNKPVIKKLKTTFSP